MNGLILYLREKMDKEMKNAVVDFTPVDVKGLGLNIRRGKKVTEGSCNLCKDRDSYDEINIIEMHHISLRLCDKCRKMLKEIL